MRYVLSVLTIVASLAAVQSAIAATEVTRTFVKSPYNYTCIMKGEIEYCGNWNVAR